MFKRVSGVLLISTLGFVGGCEEPVEDGAEGFRGNEHVFARPKSTTFTSNKKGFFPDWRDELPWPEGPDQWPEEGQQLFDELILSTMADEILQLLLEGEELQQVCQASCEDLGLMYLDTYDVETNVTVFGGPQWTGVEHGEEIELMFDMQIESALLCACGY